MEKNCRKGILNGPSGAFNASAVCVTLAGSTVDTNIEVSGPSPALGLWRAHPGRCLPDLDQVAVRVPDIRAYLGPMLLGLGEELSASR